MAQLVCSSLGQFLRVNAFACLVLCYVLLVVLGGLVFNAVEKPMERQLRAEVEEMRRSFLRSNPCVQESGLRELLGKALSAHHRNVAVLKANAEERRYDFTSSLYFVIVTLTTMGSDSYTPKSDQSKLFCVFYCCLGIPLTLSLLTILSKALLPVLTHSPLQHLHTAWGLSYPRASLLHAGLLSLAVLCLLFLLPALLLCALVEPSWSFLDALFFCLVVLSTVGQGENSLGRSWGPRARETAELLTTCYLLVGLVVILTLRDTVLQLPQVSALTRLLSGPQYAELEGSHFDELTLSEDGWEEEPQYSQSICTVSSTPLQLLSLGTDQNAVAQIHKTSTANTS